MRLTVLIICILLLGCQENKQKKIEKFSYELTTLTYKGEIDTFPPIKFKVYDAGKYEDSIIFAFKVTNQDNAFYNKHYKLTGSLSDKIFSLTPATLKEGEIFYSPLSESILINTKIYTISDSTYHIRVFENYKPPADGRILTYWADEVGIIGYYNPDWLIPTIVTNHSDNIRLQHLDSIYKLLVIDPDIMFMTSYKGVHTNITPPQLQSDIEDDWKPEPLTFPED